MQETQKEDDYAEVEIDRPEHERRGDAGGVYLVVADESEEFPVALRYAARMAEKHGGRLAVLYMTEIEDFQHWGNIEKKLRREMREQSESFIWDVARKVNDLNGLTPILYVREGDKKDVLVDVIDEDMSIHMLILAGGSGSAGPGPLVSYFTGSGLSRLRVPLVVVPGHLEPHKIDAIMQ